MHRRAILATLCLPLLTWSGCGGNDNPTSATASPSPTPSPVTVSVSSVTAEGSTATATPSSDGAYQWSTTFTVTLTQVSGVATTVRSLAAKLEQSAGGIVITPPAGLVEAYRFNVRAGTNQLAANGTLPIDFDFFYTLPNGGRQALITLTFNLVDANGNATQVTATVNVV